MIVFLCNTRAFDIQQLPSLENRSEVYLKKKKKKKKK